MANDIALSHLFRLLGAGGEKGVDRLQSQQDQLPNLYLTLQNIIHERQQDAASRLFAQKQFDETKRQNEKENLFTRQAGDRAERGLDLEEKRLAQTEYATTRASQEANLEKILGLKKQSDNAMNLAKLAEKYPQLAPIFDIAQMSSSETVLDDVLRSVSMQDKSSSVSQAGEKEVAGLAEKLLGLMNADKTGLFKVPDGMDPFTFAKKQARLMLGLDAGGGVDALENMSVDDLKRVEAELEREVANAKKR